MKYGRKRRLAILLIAAMLLSTICTTVSLGEGSGLAIDTENVYTGMDKSYAQGYVPTIKDGNAYFVLPLKTTDESISMVTVTPVIGTDDGTPFAYGNYEFNVYPAATETEGEMLFLIDLTLPLKADRVNGTYPVAFKVRYSTAEGAQEQEFSVYVTISDGQDPNAPAPTEEPAGQLSIDGNHLYDGMKKTYGQGYMPLVSKGVAYIVLPLVGETYDGRVTVTADLGNTTDSPFVYGNYSQTATHGWSALYLFTFEIPLASGRYNGSYPVTLRAEYLNSHGMQAQQTFTVYVTITDGKNPPDPNEIHKEAAERPELYISQCTVLPEVVGGNETFTVNVTIDNIGNIRARSVKLSWGSSISEILPADTTNSQLLENLAAGESVEAAFQFKTTKDVLAGNQPFTVTLEYADLYGGNYTVSRDFLIEVTQPLEMSYDTVTLPEKVTAGDTISVPANVFNIGRATLRNVTVTVRGAGLYPTGTVFLGDIAPGQAGYAQMDIFIGMLSMTEGYSTNYGETRGEYIITYYDDNDEEYVVRYDIKTEVLQPVLETDADPAEEPEPVVQWWVTVLGAFAVIAIIVSCIVVTKFTRAMKMSGR